MEKATESETELFMNDFEKLPINKEKPKPRSVSSLWFITHKCHRPLGVLTPTGLAKNSLPIGIWTGERMHSG